MGEYSTHDFNYKFTYFKKLNENVIFQDRNYGLKQIIKDDNYKINWSITNNTKKILTYNCQEAIGLFRGREYRAYFLRDIPISSGPFKFDGLPGLILEVKSTDNVVSITATDITFDEGDVINPFLNVSSLVSQQLVRPLHVRIFCMSANLHFHKNVQTFLETES